MSELPLNQILCGNCIEVLKDFPDNIIDLVITDPPYGLSFMGKDWDKTLPPKEAFAEVIRVLKPGALAFVMSSPRQDVLWRMLSMLEGVGFELTQSYIDWIYKTGFPKAYDVSKGIDKKLGLKREKGLKKKDFTKYNTDVKSGNTYEMAGNRIHRDEIGYETIPASELAKTWDGWKSQTGLKPAHEPILMVNKPFSESTIVDNVLRWGVGAINVDVCRIPFQNETDPRLENNLPRKGGFSANSEIYHNDPKYGIDSYPSKGRFPANLLVSDKALDTGKLTKSGILEPHHQRIEEKRMVYGEFKGTDKISTYGDIGDQSRYFDLDAWAKHHGFLDVPKPTSHERDFGLKGIKQHAPKMGGFKDNPGRKAPKTGYPRRNVHPTVKPIKLMAYLIELGCPPDGIVLDPFVGSGTTCIAAKQLVRKYVGIEINPEYAKMAQARIKAHPVPLSWFNEEAGHIPKP